MRTAFFAVMIWPCAVLADPSCEEIYWGEMAEEGVITDYGLLPVETAAPVGSTVAVRGADQEDADALRVCPEVYTTLRSPRLGFSQGDEVFDIPDTWSANSDFFDALVIQDPDGVGSASVMILWDTGDVITPVRGAYLADADTEGVFSVMPFDDIYALWRQGGDGLLFIHDVKGPVLEATFMRWSGH